ncbi:MAG: hypothetical protein Aurels2KO_37340 [Aureliella sp.]
MSIHPLTLVRGLLLVILSVGAQARAKAHDWPFHVDASERYITSVRMQPVCQPPQAPNRVSKLLRDFQIPPLANVMRSTIREGMRFSRYMTVPPLFQFRTEASTQLIVSSPVDAAAPIPAEKTVPPAIVYAEHCLGEEYLPYDFCSDDTSLFASRTITEQQRRSVSSSIRDVLASTNRWHCELINQLHSAQFATDAGAAISSLSNSLVQSSHSTASKLAAELIPYNADSLPKYVYLQTRSGVVLAPAHLAQQWQTSEGEESGTRSIELLVESGNEIRSVVSQQIENIAQSLHSVAQLLAPASNERVATKATTSNL